MAAERFDFPNAQGQKLAALLDRPAGEPRAYALFAHCFTCGKDIHAAKRVAEGLTALGIAVLRFDFTGLGSSEGEFANTSFSSNVADLVAAANELRRRARAPAILIGHSLGGTAVLAAAADVPEAREHEIPIGDHSADEWIAARLGTKRRTVLGAEAIRCLVFAAATRSATLEEKLVSHCAPPSSTTWFGSTRRMAVTISR